LVLVGVVHGAAFTQFRFQARGHFGAITVLVRPHVGGGEDAHVVPILERFLQSRVQPRGVTQHSIDKYVSFFLLWDLQAIEEIFKLGFGVEFNVHLGEVFFTYKTGDGTIQSDVNGDRGHPFSWLFSERTNKEASLNVALLFFADK
jgi:hypothetical protein